MDDVVEVTYTFYELTLGSLFQAMYGGTNAPLKEQSWWPRAQAIIDAIKADEREACAKVADVAARYSTEAEWIARDIRARAAPPL